MKRTIITVLILFLGQMTRGQVNDGLIDLGKAYRQFMFRDNPPENFLTALDKYDKTELSFVGDFIQETIRPGSQILSSKYLTRPNDKDLRWIYIVRQINLNVRKENPGDNNQLITALNQKEVNIRELVDNYYSMVFTAYGNKVYLDQVFQRMMMNPYDLSNIDFDMGSYVLRDDTEKGIFFLQSMMLNAMVIFGYLDIVKPPNYAKALEFINKFPKYNGIPYYQFLNLNFPDFKMQIVSDSKPESYKAYYIDKYYETLLFHVDCLRATGDNDKIKDLVLGSILKEDIYFKYSKRDKEIRKLLRAYKR